MIKAIETVYNGYRFRSRLEARWAVFFDTLGIKYEYEKEGYDLDGTWYLPDFWLPELDCWVEIKGEKATEEEIEKAKSLARGTMKHVYVFYGTLAPWSISMQIIDGEPARITFDGARGHGLLYRPFYGDVYFSDTFHIFGECSVCHNIVISFYGYAGEERPDEKDDFALSTSNDCHCHASTDDDFQSPRLIAAYTAARQARFERGRK